MIKSVTMIRSAKKRPPYSRNSHKPLHITVIPLFFSIVFLISLLLYRNIAFSNMPEDFTVPTVEMAPMDDSDTEVSAVLQAEIEYQYPELPNGCEATSLSIALGILGHATDKLEIAYDYLPSAAFTRENDVYYAPDPAVMYAGDPTTNLGFYCLDYPVVLAANQFFREHGASLTAAPLNTVTQETIDEAIKHGSPVIIWATIDYSDTAWYHSDFSWILSNGETYVPYSNLHCVVLYGFDEDIYYICDPIEGKLEIDKATLLSSMAALGNHAVSFESTAQ